MKRPSADFLNILSESGIPTTSDELESVLKTDVTNAGSTLSNDSEMSPFWRWVKAAVISPVLWLIKTLLVTHVMPNMFVATANRWALELKSWELDIEPKDAVKTTGYLLFVKESADDEITIEAGSIVQTLAIDDVVYRVLVTEKTVIKSGAESASVPVTAENAGAAYNLPAGYFNIMPVEIPGILSVVNETGWIQQLGADAETDEELALRLQNAFTSAGSWHINDVYRSIIASVAGIRSDNIFFRNTGHITPGTAEALILLDVGTTPQSVLDSLNQYIMEDGHHGHGDVLTCIAMPDKTYDVIADVVLAANLTDQQISEQYSEIEKRIRAAFRETAAFTNITRASPDSRFSLSQLSTEIHTQMEHVRSIRVSVDDVIQHDIVSELEQPRLNSLTVRALDD
ncbi:baseplate J/gp47 family protein [Vibrio quintilis]|uniref:Baseplate J-like protein n=1 Tax=Vibrio quintilis TaxID=1117707 RepID=A0A1M7YZ19_9VIBR|nr:baseplate J/gp47 family protein [Vibrio quintilis]SHO57898.1 Baseplate J-like protein [Vibrio quintilis]